MTDDHDHFFVTDDATFIPPKGMREVRERQCGCVKPALIYRGLVAELLSAMPHNSFDHPDTPGEHLFAHWAATTLGWTEHGTSVGAGWLTRHGALALAFMLEFGGNSLQSYPVPCEGTGWVMRVNLHHVTDHDPEPYGAPVPVRASSRKYGSGYEWVQLDSGRWVPKRIMDEVQEDA